MSRVTHHEPKRMHSDMIAAWQSITYDPDYVLSLLQSSLISIKDQSEKLHSGDDDDFTDVDPSTLTAPCPISDDAIIQLADHLQQRFDGLPDSVSPALRTLERNKGESPVDFAKRRLMAVLPTLIPGVDSKNSIVKLLNEWHTDLHHQHKKDFEQTLAETVYFYDDKNNRLIIRHAPAEITDDNKIKAANELQSKVTTQIIRHLAKQYAKINEATPQIHHILPSVIHGTFSLHSVLRVQSVADTAQENVTFDPATSYLSKIKVNTAYQYLGVQPITNNNDCGLYVTAMAIAAFKLLLEHPEKTASTITIDDFLKHPIQDAAKCVDSTALKVFLIQGTLEHTTPALTAQATLAQQLLNACRVGLSMFSISPSPSSSHTSSASTPTTHSPEVTPLRHDAILVPR